MYRFKDLATIVFCILRNWDTSVHACWFALPIINSHSYITSLCIPSCSRSDYTSERILYPNLHEVCFVLKKPLSTAFCRCPWLPSSLRNLCWLPSRLLWVSQQLQHHSLNKWDHHFSCSTCHPMSHKMMTIFCLFFYRSFRPQESWVSRENADALNFDPLFSDQALPSR